MKIKLTLITILITLTNLLSQKYDDNYFLYELISKKEIIQNSKTKDILEYSTSPLQFELLYLNNQGFFSPIIKLENSQENKINMTNIFMKNQGYFFYDNENKISENLKELLNKKYIIVNKYEDLNWETLEDEFIENKKYNKVKLVKKNYSVKKENDYIITVWYDKDYNLNISPFGLVGLNGIIVKIDFNNLYEVNLVESKKKNNLKINQFTKGEKISENDFNNLVNERLQELKNRYNKN